MNPSNPTDISKLCIHTITTNPWNIEEAAQNYSAAGVKGITVWRDALQARNIQQTGQMLRDQGLSIVSLCRGGFFPAKDIDKRRLAIDDNRRAIEEAHQLGTSMIVLVCGADPRQSLEDSRKQIRDGIATVLADAVAAGVKLAIEPLHPMYADARSAINTLAQANDLAEEFNSPFVGVAVDVYHLWWDPALKKEIKRCGQNENLFAFHICDWRTPTTDFLNDRGLMGDGCIPVKQIRSWVEATGFNGFVEVEVFSNNYWKENQADYLKKVINAYKEHS
ncbi:sugar phosphate isomerase/epimerase family protein [Segetibacter koreensis]|uniref:sugar phosphate isomerase/epimerase family protein n=1 Tax=Segetibacter koreensis TaxID=398037 RepID=UPI00036A6CAF|nr:sugar phosphate isomerase/epimerase family protein [Segetibacter koreensis]